MGGGDRAGGHDMITAVMPVSRVANVPGGGRFRVCTQAARGSRRLGCEVSWLEQFKFTFGTQPGIQRIARYWCRRYLGRIA